MALWIHNYSAYGRRKLWKAAGSVSFPMSDNQGVRMVITMDGDSAGSESYNSYGVSTGSTESHFGFSGGYAEPTGIVYLVHRFYDPQSGQFLDNDPKSQSSNESYMYGGDDPSNESDPSGEDPIPGGIELPSGCQGTTAGSLSPDEYTDCTIDSLSFQVLVPFADSASQIGVPNAIQVDWGISWQSSPYDETGELGQAASFAQDFDGSTTSQAEGRALLKACDNGAFRSPLKSTLNVTLSGLLPRPPILKE